MDYTLNWSRGEVVVRMPEARQLDLITDQTANAAMIKKIADICLVSPSLSEFRELYPAGLDNLGQQVLKLCGLTSTFMELEASELDEATAKIWVEAEKDEWDRMYALSYEPLDGSDPLLFILHEPTPAAMAKFEKTNHDTKDCVALVNDAAILCDHARIEKMGLFGLYTALVGFIRQHEGAQEELVLKKD